MPSDLLTEVESKIKDRVNELRPLHDEYIELQAYAERAGISLNGNTPKPAAAKPKPAPKPKPASRRKPAKKPAAKKTSSRFPNGVPDRRSDLLRVVTENPGITVREAGEKLSTDATQLYRHRNNLVEEGLLESRGPNLFPKTEGAGEGAGAGAGETLGEGDGAGA